MADNSLLIFTAIMLMLCCGMSGADTVSSEADLRTCLEGTSAECTLPPGVTIEVFGGALSASRAVIISGSGNSVIDLTSNSHFMTLPDNYPITLTNLEVRNGYSSTTAGFLQTAQNTNITMINVNVSNIFSTDRGAIYSLTDGVGHGYLSHVTFTNITGPYGSPSVIRLARPGIWTLQDLTFVNCTTSTIPSQSNPIFSATAQIAAETVPVTFGGDIIVKSVSPAWDQPIFDFLTLTATSTLAIRSKADNPSKWYFTIGKQMAIRMRVQSGDSSFEAKSFEAHDVSGLTNAYPAILATGPGKISINITDHMTTVNSGIITALATQNVLMVGGTVSSTGCLADSCILAKNPFNISAKDILITDPKATAVLLLSNTIINVSRNFEISCPSASLKTTYSALNVTSSNCEINAGGLVSINDMSKSSGHGAALAVVAGTLSISATTMVFDRNYASGYGGSIYLSSSSSLSLLAMEGMFFRNNTAAYGGVLAASNDSSITTSGPISFVSNSASWGAVLYIHPFQAATFEQATFWMNSGQADCAVSFVDSCLRFNATDGNYGGNTQNQTLCDQNDYLCGLMPVVPPVSRPISPPLSPPPPACSGSPPSLGSWKCTNGAWASNGTVEAESVTIPSGSQIVVNGDFVVSGDLTFGGLDSTVSVSGGCISIEGSLRIQLSNEDLEEISKESGSSRTVQLLAQNSSCSSLASLTVNTAKTQKSCRKVDSHKTASRDETHSSLVVIFKVDSSGCNTKWIILGCVLGGVLLIVLILILFVTFNNKIRTIVRPFSARGATREATFGKTD